MNLNKLQAASIHAPSIIVEWETVQDAGVARAERGLRELSRQIAELQEELNGQTEVIVCYEEQVVSTGELHAILDRAAVAGGWPCPLRLVPVPAGTHYYEKKNIGARVSKNEVVVLFDTDLIPDPDWLRNLLSPFSDWSTSVVFGATHLDHASHYEMGVALCWIFSPATYGRGLQSVRLYSSNNAALRRALFLKFPFPARPTYRGPCAELGQKLVEVGIPVREHTDARASHPPPVGFRAFVHRAWSAGKDERFYADLETDRRPASSLHLLFHDYGVVARRIRARRELLKPSFAGEACGWLLGAAYYAIKAAGYFAAGADRPAGLPSQETVT